MNREAYYTISDILYETTGKEATERECKLVYEELPEFLHAEARLWGWGDTLLREGIFNHLKNFKEKSNED